MDGSNPFLIGLSADVRDERGQLVFPDFGLDMLDREPGVRYEFLTEYRAEYTPEQLAPYDVVISLKPRVTSASLPGVERLTAIGRAGVGYDNVDVRACTEADVALYNTPRRCAGRWRNPSCCSFWRCRTTWSGRTGWCAPAGGWRARGSSAGASRPHPGHDRSGGIASDLLVLLQPFGFARVLAYDPYVGVQAKAWQLGAEPTPLDELLRTSDYVLINCPLTADTRRLIGARELALMKPTACLINTARGPIVDEAALAHALEAGVIRGAALDVFEAEPLPPDSPLCQLENVILTSHSVGWTEELFRDMGRADCAGALAIYRGEAPASVVNREVLDRPGFRRKLARAAKGSDAMNPVKEKLRAGGVAIGHFVLDLFTPGIGPMLAAAGMEFVIYDMEHGRCDIALLEQMAISCRGTDIVPMARVPDVNYAPISRLLDVGVRGVMIPRVETRAQMEMAVRALKYAPRGQSRRRSGRGPRSVPVGRTGLLPARPTTTP